MQPFLHDRLRRLTDLLEVGSSALRTCAQDEPRAAEVVLAYLDAAAERYRTLGLQVEENEVLALTAELHAARRGIVLATNERVTSRRRDLERTVAVRVLVQSLDRLRDDVGRDEERLRTAREQLAPVVVYAVQSGLVVTPLGEDGDPGRAAEDRWRAICEDTTTRPAALQLLTSISTADALLVLLDLLAALGPPAPARPLFPSQATDPSLH